MPTNATKGETTHIMCLLLKYKPHPSIVMPNHGNKGEKKKSKSLDPTTKEQKAWQNNMLKHKDATSKSH